MDYEILDEVMMKCVLHDNTICFVCARRFIVFPQATAMADIINTVNSEKRKKMVL